MIKANSKHIFVLSLLLGIFAFAVSLIYPLNNIVIDVILWIVMIIYALSVHLISHEKRDLSDADNAYYMGFIFTMASLALILYNADLSKKDEIGSNIISSFALALSTTILGIILRILLTPRRPDIGSHEDESRNELDKSVKYFVKTLDESNNSIRSAVEIQSKVLFDTFLKSTTLLDTCFERLNSSIISNYDKINDLLENKIPHTIQKNEDALILLNSSIASSAHKINDSIDAFRLVMIESNKILLNYNTSITTSFNSNIKSLNDFTDKVNDIKIDPAFIKAHLESVYSIYKNAAIKASKSFDESSKALNDLVKEIKDIPEAIRITIDANFEDRKWLTKNIEDANELLSRLHRQMVITNESLLENHGDIHHLLGNLSQSISSFEELIPESTKSLAFTNEIPTYLSRIALLLENISIHSIPLKELNDNRELHKTDQPASS
jgi:hypothetical protein